MGAVLPIARTAREGGEGGLRAHAPEAKRPLLPHRAVQSELQVASDMAGAGIRRKIKKADTGLGELVAEIYIGCVRIYTVLKRAK